MSVSQQYFSLRRILVWTGSLGVVAVLLSLLLHAVTVDFRIHSQGTECKNNLKNIILALHNYHETYGTFPPAYTVDANGRPLHSWRTLILPWIDQQPLYNAIDLSRPWDAPVNATAYATPVPVFHCTSERNDRLLTTYQAVAGPGAGFEFPNLRKISDFLDGTDQTALIVEVDTALAVHWMAPFDHGFEYLLTSRPETKTVHFGGSHAAIADGSVRYLPLKLDLPTRRALISIAGGETIGDW